MSKSIENRSLQKQLKVVESISNAIVGHIDIDEVLELIVTKIVVDLGYPFSAVWLLSKDDDGFNKLKISKLSIPKRLQKMLEITAGRSIFENEFNEKTKSHNKNYVLRSILEEKIFFSEKLLDFTVPYIGEKSNRAVQKISGLRKFYAIPLVARGQKQGVLTVTTKKFELAEEEIGVLQTFANQISIAIYNAQLFSRVQSQVKTLGEQAQDLKVLHDVSTFAESTPEKEKVVQRLLDIAPIKLGHLGVTAAALFLKTSKTKISMVAYTKTSMTAKAAKLILGKKSEKELSKELETPKMINKLFKTETPQVVETLHQMFPSHIKKRVDKGIKKLNKAQLYVALPIQQRGASVGAIIYSLKIPRKEYDRREEEILRVFSNHIAIALENADLYRQLQLQLQQVETHRQQLTVANEKLKVLDKAKSEFISIASHQLRTPLTVIKGYISMIEEGDIGKVDKVAMETVVKVGESTDRLVNLVNDFLDISRIEKGKMIYKKQKLRIEDVAQSTFEELEKPAKDKSLNYTFTKPKKPTPVLLVDERKLRQVMLNLIDNAIKYTPSGEVNISVKRQGKSVVFAVKDSGVGLIAGEVKNLFKKFQRGAGISVINTEGVGLGLFVARKIIEAHGGNIWAESEGKGKGSTFAFSLPIK